MTRFPGSLISVLILSALAFGQTAKQGDFGPNAFRSPMVLETVFPPADPSLWVSYDWTPSKPKPWKSGEFTTVESHGLGKYSCDGLYFRNSNRNGSYYSGLDMIKVKPVGSDTAVWFKAYVSNPGGGIPDKFVTLVFEVLHSDEVVATAKTVIKARADRSGSQDSYDSDDLKLVVPSSKLAGSRLRITMTTQDY
jgi:hypothetical protein